MNQTAHIPHIRKLLCDLEFLRRANGARNPRFIKISGGKFQENGLPDLMICFKKVTFWLELKRDWNDEPTLIQKYNISDLSENSNFIAGFVVDDEFKFAWDDETPIKLIELIKKEMM